ncbi:MAG: 30S ribosomal protein S2 [Patescibacteria group bacterium]|nr:30S ribosomal protein S2 [Patescibacteria group bacterium]
MAVDTKPKTTELSLDPQIKEMMEVGLHFGHKTSKTHPNMLPFIEGVRNTIHIIDLEKSKARLNEVLEALVTLREEGKVILLVGTKVQVKDIVKALAEELNFPYVSERWIGGMLTNFDIITKRVERLKELEEKKTGEKYKELTKKDRARFDKELSKLDTKFGGIKSLEKLPDAVFIFDVDWNALAASEAKRKGIPTFGLVDTNIDPNIVDEAIPANDDAILALKYVADQIKEKLGSIKPKEEKKEEKE